NLGLGVFEQIKEPSECDIIMDPKGATSNNSTKPKIRNPTTSSFFEKQLQRSTSSLRGSGYALPFSAENFDQKETGYQTPEQITGYKRPEGQNWGIKPPRRKTWDMKVG
ncbi:1158_t:CDS:2, partial [Funneliformis caledonium]